MLVSHLKKFIYTKTSKTASTSVESYFEKFCMPRGEWKFRGARDAYESNTGIIGYRGDKATGEQWYNHMPAADIKSGVGDTKWNDYFKFAVIRDPFDKLISQFFFVEKRTGTKEQLIEKFRAWLLDGGEIIDREAYVIQGQICLDYFIRYENLRTGIEDVCNRLEVPFEPDRLPQLKTGFRNRNIPIECFYNEFTVEIVQQKYAFELDNFGFGSPLVK